MTEDASKAIKECSIQQKDTLILDKAKLSNSDLISIAELEHITSLNINNTDLSNLQLEILGQLSNLQNLTLIMCNLKNLDFLKGFDTKKLNLISCGSNNITDISGIVYLPNIIYINLPYNRIKDISPIKNMSSIDKLFSINVQYNNISEIPVFENLKSISYFNISNNQIDDLRPIAKLLYFNKNLKVINGNGHYLANTIYLANNPLPKEVLDCVAQGREKLIGYYENLDNFYQIHEEIYKYLINNNNSLQFSLRNEKSKLKKGYWFAGDEKVLFFSFWQGYEWRNKTPNIFFSVTKDGNSSLEFVCAEDEKKLEFFKEVADTLNITKKEDATIHHWVKNYKGTDYIKSLEEFLKRDKKIIDAFIKSNDMQTVFPPIDEQEFLIAKQRIEKEREQLKIQTYAQNDDAEKYIILKSLTFKNISLFDKEYTIQFHQNLTCFIGLNGTGKTSILRGIALAFTGFEQNDLNTTEEKISLARNLQHLLHIKGIKKEAKDYPSEGGYIELNYQVGEDETTYQNRVLLTLENEAPKISDDSNSEFRNFNDKFFRSLFLAFPQLHGSSKPRNIPNKPNIYDVLPLLNNEPDNRFEAFGKWLRGLNAKANEKKAQGQPNPPESKLLDTVFKIVSDVVGESIKVHKIVVINKTDDIIWVQLGENSKPIVLELISQGYNNVFGWIGYFMMRLVEATVEDPDDIAKEIDFSQLPAIVLIDEIDTYLHPKWQAKILSVLVETFRHVQFIVTTHSPLVVANIENGMLYNIENGKVKQVPYGFYGKDYSFTLENQMDTPARNPNVQRELDNLFGLIEAENFEKAENDLKILQEKYPNEPELTRAQTTIALLKD